MKSIWVDGAEQSGPWVKKVWSKALTIKHCESCLILGLGAGVAAKLVSEKFPGVRITGVDIDPEMVAIGKKDFGLEEIPNLKIIVGDAFKILPKERFDLILVDLYVGKEYPKKAEREKFLRQLAQKLSKNGVVIFNRLTIKKGDFDLEKFLDKLGRFFAISGEAKVDYNILIYCSRKKRPWELSRLVASSSFG